MKNNKHITKVLIFFLFIMLSASCMTNRNMPVINANHYGTPGRVAQDHTQEAFISQNKNYMGGLAGSVHFNNHLSFEVGVEDERLLKLLSGLGVYIGARYTFQGKKTGDQLALDAEFGLGGGYVDAGILRIFSFTHTPLAAETRYIGFYSGIGVGYHLTNWLSAYTRLRFQYSHFWGDWYSENSGYNLTSNTGIEITVLNTVSVFGSIVVFPGRDSSQIVMPEIGASFQF